MEKLWTTESENQIGGKITMDIEDVYWKYIGVWMGLLESEMSGP
jgi:hypothetical protein